MENASEAQATKSQTGFSDRTSQSPPTQPWLQPLAVAAARIQGVAAVTVTPDQGTKGTLTAVRQHAPP